MEGGWRSVRIVKILTLIVVLLGGMIWFFHVQNRSIVVTPVDLSFDYLPASFEGFTIVHLSDYHNQNYGPRLEDLLSAVKMANPDLIAFTGDLVDMRQFHGEKALDLMRQLVTVAPVYFVNGNHEWATGQFDLLEAQLREIGVHVLRNQREVLVRREGELALLGIDDPVLENDELVALTWELSQAMAGLPEQTFTVLLSHRPEAMEVYARLSIDLALTGHAHGGQFRLPFLGGLVAPNQGFFPSYSAGVYEEQRTRMVVHRGIGNSIIPLRLLNRPEVVVIRLHQSI